ncbi:MAG TPA: Hsp70 family protein [Kofleriaceae bacterium]|nr:Hsp70 family protein [Kofleriaceae bacterium]
MSIAVGIDLGTTNSVAAVATAMGVQFAQDAWQRRIHPSVVSFPARGGVLVGHDAAAQRAADPVHTIYSAKRLIGQNLRAPLVQLALTALPFKVEEGPNQQPIIVARDRRLSVPEVSGHVLGHLKRLAEKQFADVVKQAVITVPANFTDAQRQATREAGRLAGLEVLRLVNEPTAAALAYGYGQRLDEMVAVYDFGGGTFDLSILRIRAEIFEVVASDGDFFLGGDDLDRTLAEHLAAQLNRIHGIDPRSQPLVMTRLTMAAEQIKCHLSTETVAEGSIDSLVVEGRSQPLSVPFRVTREQFDRMITGYVDRTIDVCRNVLTHARIDPAQLSEIICVGGTTRVPLVRDRLGDLFGRDPSVGINPDEVVAHGAAIQAAALAGALDAPARTQMGTAPTMEVPASALQTARMPAAAAPGAGPPPIDMPGAAPPPPQAEVAPYHATAHPAQRMAAVRPVLMDVNPATLRIATAGGWSESILDKNAPIPIERTKVFTTAHDRQTHVVIDCGRGEERKFADNEPLGTLELDGLPAKLRGESQIEVTFRVDADGILHVRAKDKQTGTKAEAKLTVLGAPVAPPEGES